MSFLRPEARETLWRWREALAGAATLALGLYWIIGPGRLLGWVGAAVAVLGGVLIGAGVQRARFRRGRDGPGVVKVVEGELAYFGPVTGGTMTLADLVSVSKLRGEWHLTGIGGTYLQIPMDAEGAEALFDVFATLPGLSMSQLLRDAPETGGQAQLVWRKQAPRLH